MKKIGLADNTALPHISYSSLSTFLRCPRAYYWNKEQNIILSKPNNALINGLAYHNAKAVYHQARLKGVEHELASKESLDILAKEMLDKIVESDDLKYSAPVAVDTMKVYFDMWKDETWLTQDIEVHFGIDFKEFVFVGKIDRLVKSPFTNELAVEETKTTSIVGERWGKRLKPNLQIDGYIAALVIILGIEVGQAILDVIPLHADNKKRKLPFRYITYRSASDIDEWVNDTVESWDLIQHCKSKGQWPRNTESCCPLVGFECNYTTLCGLYPSIKDVKSIQLPAEYKVEVRDVSKILENGGA